MNDASTVHPASDTQPQAKPSAFSAWLKTPFRELIGRNRQALMGFAILCIVACHAGFRIPVWRILYPLYDVQNLLYGGVDIFFFLSGFGVCRSLDHNGDAALFLKKRLLRIYPVYLPLAVLWIVSVSLMHPMSANSILGVLTGLGFFLQQPDQFMWFVPAILLFYALSPYLHAFLRRAKNLHAAFTLLLFGSLVLGVMSFFTWQILALPRLTIYLLGMYVYAATEKRHRFDGVVEIALYVLMYAGIQLTRFLPAWVEDGYRYYHGLFEYPMLLIVPGLSLLAARIFDLLRRCFLRFLVRFSECLGRCSLELCLIHFLVFQTAAHYMGFNNWTRLGLGVLSILLSIPYAALMRKLTAQKSPPCG